MQQVLFNDYVNTALTGLFIFVILSTVVDSVRTMCCVQGRKTNQQYTKLRTKQYPLAMGDTNKQCLLTTHAQCFSIFAETIRKTQADT